MSDHRLSPLPALMGPAPRVDQIGAFSLREDPDVALASFAARRGLEDDARAALRDLIGVAPPGVERWAGGDAIAAFWMGADQWMLHAPYRSHEDLAARAKAAAGDAASITEQSDAWVVFTLDGPGVDGVLERLCAVDLENLAPGAAIRTVMEHIGVFLLGRASTAGVDILGPRSSAGSLHHALITAARSVAAIETIPQ